MTCACGREILGRTEYEALPKSERAGKSCWADGTCRPCYKARRRAAGLEGGPRRLGPRPASKEWHHRQNFLEDVTDILAAEPATTLAGLALRLGRSHDAITLALRRAARDGYDQAVAIRRHLNLKEITP